MKNYTIHSFVYKKSKFLFTFSGSYESTPFLSKECFEAPVLDINSDKNVPNFLQIKALCDDVDISPYSIFTIIHGLLNPKIYDHWIIGHDFDYIDWNPDTRLFEEYEGHECKVINTYTQNDMIVFFYYYFNSYKICIEKYTKQKYKENIQNMQWYKKFLEELPKLQKIYNELTEKGEIQIT